MSGGDAGWQVKLCAIPERTAVECFVYSVDVVCVVWIFLLASVDVCCKHHARHHARHCFFHVVAYFGHHTAAVWHIGFGHDAPLDVVVGVE